MSNNESKISWEAPEWRHYEKNVGWYVTLVAVLVLIVSYQILQKDYFGGLSIAILGMFVLMFARQRPKRIQIELNPKGIYLDTFHIPYKTIRHFWVVNKPNHKTLNLETTAYLNRFVILELEDQNPDAIREFLSQVVPEHEQTDETLTQRIMHRLKF